MLPTIDGMKTELRDQLSSMLEWRRQYQDADSGLYRLGIFSDSSTISLIYAVETIIKNYFTSMSSALTKKYSENTPAKLVIDSKLYSFLDVPRFKYRNSSDDGCTLNPHFRRVLMDADDAGMLDQAYLVNQVISRIDYDSIVSGIQDQLKSLVNSGLREMVTKFILDLNMRSNRRPFHFKYKRIIFEKSPVQWYDASDELKTMRRTLSSLVSIAELSGVHFGSGLYEYIQAIGNLKYDTDETIPTGTVFGKNLPLEIRCFKNKHQFRFSTTAFEAICAWVTLYGDEEQSSFINEIVEQLAKAA